MPSRLLLPSSTLLRPLLVMDGMQYLSAYVTPESVVDVQHATHITQCAITQTRAQARCRRPRTPTAVATLLHFLSQGILCVCEVLGADIPTAPAERRRACGPCVRAVLSQNLPSPGPRLPRARCTVAPRTRRPLTVPCCTVCPLSSVLHLDVSSFLSVFTARLSSPSTTKTLRCACLPLLVSSILSS